MVARVQTRDGAEQTEAIAASQALAVERLEQILWKAADPRNAKATGKDELDERKLDPRTVAAIDEVLEQILWKEAGGGKRRPGQGSEEEGASTDEARLRRFQRVFSDVKDELGLSGKLESIDFSRDGAATSAKKDTGRDPVERLIDALSVTGGKDEKAVDRPLSDREKKLASLRSSMSTVVGPAAAEVDTNLASPANSVASQQAREIGHDTSRHMADILALARVAANEWQAREGHIFNEPTRNRLAGVDRQVAYGEGASLMASLKPSDAEPYTQPDANHHREVVRTKMRGGWLAS